MNIGPEKGSVGRKPVGSHLGSGVSRVPMKFAIFGSSKKPNVRSGYLENPANLRGRQASRVNGETGGVTWKSTTGGIRGCFLFGRGSDSNSQKHDLKAHTVAVR